MKYLIFLILILSLSNLSSKEVKKYFKCEKGETKIYLYDDKIVIHCYSFENNKLRKIEIKTNSKKDLKFFKELNQSDYNFDILMKNKEIIIIIKEELFSDEKLFSFLNTV